MLLRDDFNTHVYAELIAAIERNEPLLDAAISAAEAQAKGYLSRYDVDALFDTVGAERDAFLLMLLKDLASWHFVQLANPNIHLDIIRTRYEDAIMSLKSIQAGKHVPQGWPPATPASASTFFQLSSQKRRNTSY